jgi:hypothetical protein
MNKFTSLLIRRSCSRGFSTNSTGCQFKEKQPNSIEAVSNVGLLGCLGYLTYSTYKSEKRVQESEKLLQESLDRLKEARKQYEWSEKLDNERISVQKQREETIKQLRGL